MGGGGGDTRNIPGILTSILFSPLNPRGKAVIKRKKEYIINNSFTCACQQLLSVCLQVVKVDSSLNRLNVKQSFFPLMLLLFAVFYGQAKTTADGFRQNSRRGEPAATKTKKQVFRSVWLHRSVQYKCTIQRTV